MVTANNNKKADFTPATVKIARIGLMFTLLFATMLLVSGCTQPGDNESQIGFEQVDTVKGSTLPSPNNLNIDAEEYLTLFDTSACDGISDENRILFWLTPFGSHYSSKAKFTLAGSGDVCIKIENGEWIPPGEIGTLPMPSPLVKIDGNPIPLIDNNRLPWAKAVLLDRSSVGDTFVLSASVSEDVKKGSLDITVYGPGINLDNQHREAVRVDLARSNIEKLPKDEIFDFHVGLSKWTKLADVKKLVDSANLKLVQLSYTISNRRRLNSSADIGPEDLVNVQVEKDLQGWSKYVSPDDKNPFKEAIDLGVDQSVEVGELALMATPSEILNWWSANPGFIRIIKPSFPELSPPPIVSPGEVMK